MDTFEEPYDLSQRWWEFIVRLVRTHPLGLGLASCVLIVGIIAGVLNWSPGDIAGAKTKMHGDGGEQSGTLVVGQINSQGAGQASQGASQGAGQVSQGTGQGGGQASEGAVSSNNGVGFGGAQGNAGRPQNTGASNNGSGNSANGAVVGGTGSAHGAGNAVGSGNTAGNTIVVNPGNGAHGVSNGAASQHGARNTAGGNGSDSNSVENPVWITIHIVGAVNRPGVYLIRSTDRIKSAILAAGGFSEEAEQRSVNLAAFAVDGQQIVVAKRGEPFSPPVQGNTGGAGGSSGGSGGSGGGSGGKNPAPHSISLSTATAGELEQIPGIGPKTAQAIIAYREANGPFSSVEQLTSVDGIGPKKAANINQYVVP